MLVELHVHQLGIIDSVTLVFKHGLTAFTGETGAGKTMIIEAIHLLVGGKSDVSMVRHGCDEARVEGRFVIGDEEIILSRVIPVQGRSRAYINGSLATLAQLAEMGADLVDLHGQHAHQSLLHEKAQRVAFAGAVPPVGMRKAVAGGGETSTTLPSAFACALPEVVRGGVARASKPPNGASAGGNAREAEGARGRP